MTPISSFSPAPRRAGGTLLATAGPLVLALMLPLATQAAPDWEAIAQERCRAAAPAAAHCDDPEWLAAEAQRLQTQEVARRAAVRGNRQEQRALREIVQGSDFCKTQLQQYCAEGNSCGSQLVAMCRSAASQRAHCVTQAEQYCRQQRLRNCSATIKQQCPADSKQELDQILARYDLNATQEARLRQLATQLGHNDRSRLGQLVAQLSQLLGLR